MKFNTFIYLFKEGCKNLWTSRKTAIASFVIILATMLILGIFMLIANNVESLIETVEGEQGISVFLEDIDQQTTNELKAKIENMYSVSEVEYISKEQALESQKERLSEESQIIFEGYEEGENPFPASFIVKLNDLEQSNNIKKQLELLEHVEEVYSGDDTTEKLIMIGKYINYGIFALLVVLLAISVFIISNSIKITMYARRKEISIMKYVGATDGFIRMPFIIEGIIIGIVGAAIATLVIWGLYSNIYGGMQNISDNIISATYKNAMVPFRDILDNLLIIYVALGVGIGVIGSSMSIKKYLDV